MQGTVTVLLRRSNHIYKIINLKHIHRTNMSTAAFVKDKAYVNGQWVSAKSGATYEGITIVKFLFIF